MSRAVNRSVRYVISGRPGLYRSILAKAAGLMVLAALLPGPAQAQYRSRQPVDTAAAQAPVPRINAGAQDRSGGRLISLGIGKSMLVELPRDAKEVFVANPSIANAVIRSARKLFLIGMASGTTSIFITDADGQQIAALEITIGREMGVLERTIRHAVANSTVKATPIGDTIILTGTVDTVLDAQKAVDIANGFVGTSFVGPPPPAGGAAGSVSIGGGGGEVVTGKVINSITVRGKDQVMLKVTVAEVQRTALKQLGVNINGIWEVGGTRWFGRNFNPFPVNTQVLNPGSVIGPSTQYGSPFQKDFNIQAMERQGVIRTLAEPTLTAISGETAKFTAGGEIPIPKSGECTSVRSANTECSKVNFDFKPYGVQLVFTPVVLSEGRISLRVATEVTDIDSERQFVTPGYNVPAFRVRRQDTTVELPSGGSMVTAGLIQQVNKQVINGLPGLMNLPILGTLFRSRDYNRQETELVIIVTPFIAKSTSLAQLARPDDGYADATDLQTILMGRLNKIYGAANTARPASTYHGKAGFIHD